MMLTTRIPLLLLLLATTTVSHGLPSNLKIGGLFAQDESQQEIVFKFAVDKINSDPNLLSQSTLTPLIEKIDKNDSFHADKKGKKNNKKAIDFFERDFSGHKEGK